MRIKYETEIVFNGEMCDEYECKGAHCIDGYWYVCRFFVDEHGEPESLEMRRAVSEPYRCEQCIEYEKSLRQGTETGSRGAASA